MIFNLFAGEVFASLNRLQSLDDSFVLESPSISAAFSEAMVVMKYSDKKTKLLSVPENRPGSVTAFITGNKSFKKNWLRDIILKL